MNHLSEKLYYEPDRPSALGGVNKLYRAECRYGVGTLLNWLRWLNQQQGYKGRHGLTDTIYITYPSRHIAFSRLCNSLTCCCLRTTNFFPYHQQVIPFIQWGDGDISVYGGTHPYGQVGNGVGGMFRSLFRTPPPFLKKTARKSVEANAQYQIGNLNANCASFWKTFTHRNN